VTGRTSRKVYS